MTHRITDDAHAIRMLMLRHFTNHICELLDEVTRGEYADEAFTWRIVRCADDECVAVTAVSRTSGDVIEAKGSLHDEAGYGTITVAVTTQCAVPADDEEEELMRHVRAQVHVTGVDLAGLDGALRNAYTQASRASRACAHRGREADTVRI